MEDEEAVDHQVYGPHRSSFDCQFDVKRIFAKAGALDVFALSLYPSEGYTEMALFSSTEMGRWYRISQKFCELSTSLRNYGLLLRAAGGSIQCTRVRIDLVASGSPPTTPLESRHCSALVFVE